MPPITSLLNIDGFELEDISGLDPIVFKVRYRLALECVHCQNPFLRIKDTFYRQVRHESFGARKVYLYLKTHKYLCKTCGRYFNDRFPGILPYRRSTQAFRKEVFEKHHDGICQKLLSNRLDIAQATVRTLLPGLLSPQTYPKSKPTLPPGLGH